MREAWDLDDIIMSLFNRFCSPLEIAPQHRNAGSRNVSWDHRRVSRRVLCLIHQFLRCSLVTEALRGAARCPVTGGDLGIWNKASLCCSTALAFSPAATTSLSHHNPPGNGPRRINAPPGPESYERAICSYKGACQRRTRGRGQMYRQPLLYLRVSGDVFGSVWTV